MPGRDRWIARLEPTLAGLRRWRATPAPAEWRPRATARAWCLHSEPAPTRRRHGRGGRRVALPEVEFFRVSGGETDPPSVLLSSRSWSFGEDLEVAFDSGAILLWRHAV